MSDGRDASSSGLGDDAASDMPFVSVIIPARNAESALPSTLDSVLSQEYSGDFEVVVADGSDSDATADLIRERYSGVRLVDNPDGSTPSALNRAIEVSGGDVIVRCDTHSVLPSGYIQRAVETLLRTGASNVGGQQFAVGETYFERAVALAQTTPLGVGDARYRLGGGAEGPADTVYLGVFRRDMLDSVGGYDTDLMRNQDYELNWRLQQNGGIVWFDPELVVRYRPRRSLGALAVQYFDYGRWKSVMLRRDCGSMRPRHFASPLLVLGLIVSAILGVAGVGMPWLPFGLPIIYLTALLLGMVTVGVHRRDTAALLLPIVFATMHISWGIGFFLSAKRRSRQRG